MEGQKKRDALEELIREPPVADINRAPVLRTYAELDRVTESAGRSMGKNDLWIAATAAATDAWLLTTDQDFDYLHEQRLIRREWFDPR